MRIKFLKSLSKKHNKGKMVKLKIDVDHVCPNMKKFPSGSLGVLEDFINPHAVVRLKEQTEDGFSEHRILVHKDWLQFGL